MAIAMALCLISAVVAFGGVTVENMAVPFALSVLLAIMWACKLLFAPRVSLLCSPLQLPVVAFAAYAGVRCFLSPLPYDSKVEFFHVGLYTFAFFFAASNLYRARHRQIVLVVLMSLAVAESIYAIWQFAARSDMVLYMNRPAEYNGRASGTYICPNHLAGLLEMILGLLLARVALRRTRSSDIEGGTLQKVFIVYAALMAIVGIILSISRGGWISTIVGLILLMFWGDWRLRLVWPRVVVASVGIAVLLFLTFNLDTVRDRFAQSVDKQDPKRDLTVGGRTVVWKSTLAMIGERPLWGSGPGTWQWFYPEHRDPTTQVQVLFAHQDVLHLVSDYGLVGAALVIAILAGFFWHTIRLSRGANNSEQRSFAVGSGVAVAMMLVHSWLDFNLHIPANALLLVTIMGMTMGIEVKGESSVRVPINLPYRIVSSVLLMTLAFATVWYGAPIVLANRFNSIGVDAREVLRWEEAITHFRRAASHDAQFAEPHMWMGDIFSRQADFRRGAAREEAIRQAIDSFRQSLARNPRQAEVWLRLAYAYELADNRDDALKAHKEAIELDPNNSFVWLRLGMFYRRIGDIPRAKEAIKKSYDLKPDRVNALHWEELRDIPTEPPPGSK